MMKRGRGEVEDVLLLEDNAAAAERLRHAGVGSVDTGMTITVRVHRISGSKKVIAASRTYEAGSMRSKRSARLDLAMRLLDRAAGRGNPTIVAGASYGSSVKFRELLAARDLPFVLQIRAGTAVSLMTMGHATVQAGEVLARSQWKKLTAVMPDGVKVGCSAAMLGDVALASGRARLFAAQIGGIKGVHGGAILGLASVSASLSNLVRLISHARWVRGATRQKARRAHDSGVEVETAETAATLTVRTNIASARRHDAHAFVPLQMLDSAATGQLRSATRILNIVELFSGAGGMGLGFLLGGGADAQYRIVYSGEANPIFAETLRRNHGAFSRMRGKAVGTLTPEVIRPADLRRKEALRDAVAAATEAGGTHLLIGGPPCQGFSMANRNSQWSGNPHNELVDVFLNYIRKLKPLVFLMENVQGILWTPSGTGAVPVIDVIERRMRAAGYIVFPKLLDAVWYGAPQHRTRFFLMGLHRDLGYCRDSFGEWGPFPTPTHGTAAQPWVTVKEAIADLPRIDNGASSEALDYSEPSPNELQRNQFLQYVRNESEQGVIFDHTTSRHADYVIERYGRIPPGGNWESIRDDLTNYADVERTHSNIYRRLRWDEPAVTIGHYRKSMLVHPAQHRGLSLREASRLQSFPDWFRFAGATNGGSGGLIHKQQQLANAVCPLVGKALAEFILDL